MRQWQTKIDNTAPNGTGLLTAAEDNARGNELAEAVESAGIALDGQSGPDTDYTMLAQAMARYASGGIVCQDSGAANAYVLSSVGDFVMPKAYFQGMLVCFYPSANNTGASTVNAFGLGTRKLLSSGGTALAADAVIDDRLTQAMYDISADEGNGAFLLCPWAEPIVVEPGEGAPLENVGDGANVYKQFDGTYYELRSVKGVNGIATAVNGDVVEVDGSALQGGLAPFYPEVETVDYKLTVSSTTAQVTVDAGQTFIHRGARRIDTDDYLEANRQFATSASKTYHLRWRWNDGSPLFQLLDTTNAGYNPGASPEDDVAFDSTYDDMLIAKVVTDGSNLPTVTALANKHTLRAVVNNQGNITGTTGNSKGRTATHTMDWARTPDLLPAWQLTTTSRAGSSDGSVGFSGSDVHDHDAMLSIQENTRYGWEIVVLRDYAHRQDINVLMLA